MLALDELLQQFTPIVVMLGFVDHLDLTGNYKSLRDPYAGNDDVAEAVISLYNGCRDVRNALKNEWSRAVFIGGPGYKQWPKPCKKLLLRWR